MFGESQLEHFHGLDVHETLPAESSVQKIINCTKLDLFFSLFGKKLKYKPVYIETEGEKWTTTPKVPDKTST